MESMLAFTQTCINKDKPKMFFDWKKAIEIIKEKRPQQAKAGLRDDWEYSGIIIYRNGKFIDREDIFINLSSTFATPELYVDGKIIECFYYKEETFTPQENKKTNIKLNGLILAVKCDCNPIIVNNSMKYCDKCADGYGYILTRDGKELLDFINRFKN